MTQISTLTPEQHDTFRREGVLRLEGLLSAEPVRRAREAVLGRLQQLGLWKDGAWRLNDAPRPAWPDRGLRAKEIGNKHAALEALIEEPRLLAAVDALLDGRAFDRALYKRPQLLFSLPNAGAWTVPNGWHVDSPRLASGACPGVQLFTFLQPVEPRGGGTLVVAGSHRLLNEGRFIRAEEIRRRLRGEPFFRELYSDAPADAVERARLMDETVTLGDAALRLVELTGAPGDAWFVDMGVLHTGAPNARDVPRMMATHRFLRADLAAELADGFGWT